MHDQPHSEPDFPSWRPPEPPPSPAPRTLARVLLLGGLICGAFDLLCWGKGWPSFIPLPGYLVVFLWALRAFDIGIPLAKVGWWFSIFWHAWFLLGTLIALPVALALAARGSVISSAFLLALLPHAWLITAFLLSVKGLRAESRLDWHAFWERSVASRSGGG